MITQDGRTLEVLTIADLKVDHRYQRALDQNLVERILRDFDPMAADAITVSQREDGSQYIVNGQHRAAATALYGETEILAFVYTGLSVPEEAALRLKANNRRPDTPLERFHAQVTAGDEQSLQIVELATLFNTRINEVANSHTGINCISAVERMFKADKVALKRTFQLITESLGQDAIKGDVATGSALRGLWWFVRNHDGEADMRNFKKRFERAGVADLLRKMRNHKAVMAGPDWLNFYRALVEAYNFHRPEHTRIEARVKHYAEADKGPSGTNPSMSGFAR